MVKIEEEGGEKMSERKDEIVSMGKKNENDPLTYR